MATMSTRTKRRKLTISAIIDEIEEEESEGRCMQKYFKVFLEINSNWIYIYKEPERTMGGLGGGVEMETSRLARRCSMCCWRFNTHVQYTKNMASPRVSTYPKGSAQSLSQLGPTAQWGRLRKRGDDRNDSLHGNLGHMITSSTDDLKYSI